MTYNFMPLLFYRFDLIRNDHHCILNIQIHFYNINIALFIFLLVFLYIDKYLDLNTIQQNIINTYLFRRKSHKMIILNFQKVKFHNFQNHRECTQNYKFDIYLLKFRIFNTNRLNFFKYKNFLLKNNFHYIPDN